MIDVSYDTWLSAVAQRKLLNYNCSQKVKLLSSRLNYLSHGDSSRSFNKDRSWGIEWINPTMYIKVQ